MTLSSLDDEPVVPGAGVFLPAGPDLAPASPHDPTDTWLLRASAPAAMTDQSDVSARLGARRLAEISTAPPPPLLIERLDPEGHTILYGTGGTGKGMVAAWWIVRLVRAGGTVLILDYENHPGEWARRVQGLGGADVLGHAIHVAPLTAAWGGTRGPLWSQHEEIRQLALAIEATYVVIDSIVPACGGVDPMKPEAAALYAGGLEYIGLPALSLGHVNRADDLRYPFGSVFWHNLARTTWSLQRDGERAILQHRKHNNYAALGRFIVESTWHDDLLGEVAELDYGVVLADRIDVVLAGEALTIADILAKVNAELQEDEEPLKADSIRAALRRGIRATARRPQRFTVDGTGENATYRRAIR
jgi:AAA domain